MRTHATIRLALAALIITSMAFACTHSDATPTPPTTQAPIPLPTNTPVIELWNSGLYLANIKPTLLFAAWPDGRVARTLDGRTRLGMVSPAAISRLLADIKTAGAAHPPLYICGVVADGSQLTLNVSLDHHTTQLMYGGQTNFAAFASMASPSQAQCEAFVRMWHSIMKSIDDVKPAAMEEAPLNLNLQIPAPGC